MPPTNECWRETPRTFILIYDILLEFHGVRSVVLAAFVLNHRDFECKIPDIFTKFKFSILRVIFRQQTSAGEKDQGLLS
jgi:hypothetical protein